MTPQPWQTDHQLVDDGARLGQILRQSGRRKTAPLQGVDCGDQEVTSGAHLRMCTTTDGGRLVNGHSSVCLALCGADCRNSRVSSDRSSSRVSDVYVFAARDERTSKNRILT